MKLLDGMHADAVLSPCGTYRYMLRRVWDRWGRGICWIMLNPSTADAEEDDRTIRKCQEFSRAWGFGGLTVVNLFALRSTDPKALKRHPAPVGPYNDAHILERASEAHLVVCAWGVHGALRNRGLIVERNLIRAGVTLHRLGPPTKGGHPGHPLYLSSDTPLEVHALLVEREDGE